jgi:restriction system protein
MAAKRIRTEDLMDLASRIPWRVGLGLAVTSAVTLHLLAEALASPVHAARIEDIKYAALKSACWTLAGIGQFVVPLILGIGALASFLRRRRKVSTSEHSPQSRRH